MNESATLEKEVHAAAITIDEEEIAMPMMLQLHMY